MDDSHAEGDLFDRAVSGDHGAFTSLVEPNPTSFRQFYQMLGSGTDAEDATQDASQFPGPPYANEVAVAEMSYTPPPAGRAPAKSPAASCVPSNWYPVTRSAPG
jgi:hypothetical protein